MLKEYTINALILGNDSYKVARSKLKELKIGPSQIDHLSHLDHKDKSVHIVRSHKGYLCATYGFIFGAGLGLLVLILNQIDLGFSIADIHFQLAVEKLWFHLSSGAAVGAIAGFIIGQRLVQYFVSYDKVKGAPQFHHLMMVEVDEAKKEKVVEALRPLSESVDILDNHTEVELGLREREAL